jgi:phenylalanyl-tRNA synthetase alpha subunit
MDIKFQIAGLRDTALNELNAISQSKDLETWRVRYLGKKSQLTELLRSLSGLPIEERKEAGALSNTLKLEMEAAGINLGFKCWAGYFASWKTLSSGASTPYESGNIRNQ